MCYCASSVRMPTVASSSICTSIAYMYITLIRHEKLCFCCVCRIASAHATKDGDESDETSKDDDWANEKKGMPVANYTASLIEI